MAPTDKTKHSCWGQSYGATHHTLDMSGIMSGLDGGMMSSTRVPAPVRGGEGVELGQIYSYNYKCKAETNLEETKKLV